MHKEKVETRFGRSDPSPRRRRGGCRSGRRFGRAGEARRAGGGEPVLSARRVERVAGCVYLVAIREAELEASCDHYRQVAERYLVCDERVSRSPARRTR